MRKSIIVLLCSACLMTLCSFKASAQLEYAYPHSIDMQLGYTLTPLTVNGDSGKAHGISDGTVFDIRYTGFITPHFGLFGEFGFAGTDLNDVRYFSVVNRADGYNYRYSNIDPSSIFTHDPYSANYAPIFKAGVAYRYDFGQLSFRPRVGLGVTGFKMNTSEYDRVANNGETQYVVTTMRTNRDYLVDDIYREREPALVLTASAQLTYTIFDHVYFSLEAGLDAIPETVSYNRQVSSNKTQVKSTNYSQSIPDMLSFKVGIGWNIGWNRNYRRGYPVGRPVPGRY